MAVEHPLPSGLLPSAQESHLISNRIASTAPEGPASAILKLTGLTLDSASPRDAAFVSPPVGTYTPTPRIYEVVSPQYCASGELSVPNGRESSGRGVRLLAAGLTLVGSSCRFVETLTASQREAIQPVQPAHPVAHRGRHEAGPMDRP